MTSTQREAGALPVVNRLHLSSQSAVPQRWISGLLLRANWGHLVLSQALLLNRASLWLGFPQAKLSSAICARALLGWCLLMPVTLQHLPT